MRDRREEKDLGEKGRRIEKEDERGEVLRQDLVAEEAVFCFTKHERRGECVWSEFARVNGRS